MAYNKITLYGNQVCDYLYIQTEKPSENDFSHVNDEPLGWGNSTVLYANFNDPEKPLAAGDSTAVGSIVGYEVYRKKYNESHSEYIGTIKKSDSKAGDLMVDYAVRNGVEYSYYFYPKTDMSQGGATLFPLVTKQYAINCPYWSLLIVDETDEENVYYRRCPFDGRVAIGAEALHRILHYVGRKLLAGGLWAGESTQEYACRRGWQTHILQLRCWDAELYVGARMGVYSTPHHCGFLRSIGRV